MARLKAVGSIIAWGSNGDGQITVPGTNSGFTAVAAGSLHSLGLKVDGSVVAWGNSGDGRTNVPSPNSDFVAIAGGVYDSGGLKTGGRYDRQTKD